MLTALQRPARGLLLALAALVACPLPASICAAEEPDPAELLLGPEPIEPKGDPVPGDEPGGREKRKASELLALAAKALAAEGASSEAKAHVELAGGRVGEALKLLESPKGTRTEAKGTVLRALALIRAGEPGEAAGLLREAAALIESKGSLTIRNLCFADRVMSFGDWHKAKTVFEPGQRVMTYCELFGFACVRLGPSKCAVRLKIDIGIDRADGSHFIESLRKDLLEHGTKSRIHDLHLCTRLDLPAGIPPGKYVLRATVTDRATGASSSAGASFEVSGGGDGGGGK